MTYKQLKEEIEKFDEEQITSDVSIYLPWEDEYRLLKEVTFATKDNGILDSEHPILYILD